MKKTILFITISLLFACGKSNSGHIPSGVIPPDSMVQVLTDVHIFQAMLQLGDYRNDSASTLRSAFLNVLKKHHLTEADYKKCTQYYSSHPALLDSVYEKVLNNLSQLKAEQLGTQKHP